MNNVSIRFIIKGNNGLVLIQDNCAMYITLSVKNEKTGLRIDMTPAVPYSTPFNYPIEDYFGTIKE